MIKYLTLARYDESVTAINIDIEPLRNCYSGQQNVRMSSYCRAYELKF